MKSFRRSIKAVSPVIATIIIVAIAITMSIAVAYWLLGLGSSFTKFEKVEFTTGYADNADNYPASGNFTNAYVAHLDLKNTGSAAATIDPSLLLYNGKPASAYGGVTSIIVYNGTATAHEITTAFTLNPGQITNGLQIIFNGGATSTWQSGMTVEITVHTTGGKDYPKALTLP